MEIDKKQILIDEINEFINSDINSPIIRLDVFTNDNGSNLCLKNYLKDYDLSLLDIRLYSKNGKDIILNDHPFYKTLLVMDNKTKLRKLIGYGYSFAPIVQLNDLELRQIMNIHRNIVLDESYSSHFQKISQKICEIKKYIGKYLLFEKKDVVTINKISEIDASIETNSVDIKYGTLVFNNNNLSSNSFTNVSRKIDIPTLIYLIDNVFKHNIVLTTKEEIAEYKESIKKSIDRKVNRWFSKISK